jgi:hypothetical protein
MQLCDMRVSSLILKPNHAFEVKAVNSSSNEQYGTRVEDEISVTYQQKHNVQRH